MEMPATSSGPLKINGTEASRRCYRYFVSKRLEGFRPDLVFARRRKVIFVHGCFWHGHPTCGHDRVPKTRTDYWRKKIEGNRLRDERARNALERSGWCVMVLWECEISRAAGFLPHVMEFLGPPRWIIVSIR